jgi:hypothetical protein
MLCRWSSPVFLGDFLKILFLQAQQLSRQSLTCRFGIGRFVQIDFRQVISIQKRGQEGPLLETIHPGEGLDFDLPDVPAGPTQPSSPGQ